MTTAAPSSQPPTSSPGSTIISPSEPSTEDEASYEDLSDEDLYKQMEGRYGIIRDADIILAIGFAHEAMRIAYIAGNMDEVRERGVYVFTRSRWLAHRMRMASRRASGVMVAAVPLIPQVTRQKLRGMLNRSGRPLARTSTWNWLEEELCHTPNSTPWHDYAPESPHSSRHGGAPEPERQSPLASTQDENRLAALYCESDLTLEQCKSFFGIP
ncbi:hypothetical protein P7C70_g4135, partial [Phenoliferia sp. Uapishka_3]